jgi:hypothetical protein
MTTTEEKLGRVETVEMIELLEKWMRTRRLPALRIQIDPIPVPGLGLARRVLCGVLVAP